MGGKVGLACRIDYGGIGSNSTKNLALTGIIIIYQNRERGRSKKKKKGVDILCKLTERV